MLQVWTSFALSFLLQILNSQFMKTKQQVTEEKKDKQTNGPNGTQAHKNAQRLTKNLNKNSKTEGSGRVQ